MTSNIDEEEPMEIDNPEEEEGNSILVSPAEPPEPDPLPTPNETEEGSNSSILENERRISTESNNENVAEKNDVVSQNGFQGMEEITLNEGVVVGEGEEAEELQLHLSAPDFGDEGDEQEQLFGNDESSIDNMDDPLLGGQIGEESGPVSNLARGQDFDPTESSLERTENEESEAVTSLLDGDDGSLIIDEIGDKSLSRALESDESISNKEVEDDGQVKDKVDDDEDNPTENVSGDEKDSKDDVNEEDSEPKIRLRMDGIFEQQEDEEEEEDEEQKLDVQSMMQMNFQENEPDTSSQKRTQQKPDVESTDEGTPTRRHLPRRAAAAAAANTIRELSNVEEEIEESTSRRGRKEYDKTFRVSDHIAGLSEHRKPLHKCGVCKKYSPCPIKIQQFGTDVHLCSNSCFNTMRHPDSKGAKRRLACVKCSLSNQAGTETYYWETMNFCSDLCVGSYQVEIGGKCATCYKKVPWISMGKYCVRFGSDIRQFCTGGCLESYKKNARVCFHCQLDIKRLGNVILANIPSKATPKEFCSQDCVEMYVEQNLNQTVKSRANQLSTCVMCSEYRLIFRELVLPSAKALKACSLMCWNKMVESKAFTKPVKCEKCIKYINLDDEFEPPAHYVATEEKMFCFCSATCKNVFVLNNRQILSCTSCKVKKYNYDLVQYFNNRAFAYAVCSLNCLPKNADYITNLKCTLIPPSSASEMVSRNGSTAVFTEDIDNGSFPVISSVTSIPPEPVLQNTSNQFNAVGGLAGVVQAQLQSIASSIVVSNTMTMGTFSLPEGYETCNVSSSTGVADFLNSCGDYTGPDENRWDGILRDADVADILDLLKPPVETKTKYTMAKPKNKVAETQTDVSELDDMQRVPLKTVEKIRYVPFPIPYPVYLPTPGYFAETPVPYPFAIPIPIPIPIPIIFDGVSGELRTGSSPWAANPSGQDKDVQSDSLNVPPVNDSSAIDSSNDVEIMDCADPCSQSAEDSSTQNLDSPSLANLATTFTNTVSQANPVSTFAVSTSSAFPGSSPSQFLSGNGSDVASSPGGGRRKLTRVEYGIRAWKMSFGTHSEPLNYSADELATKLAEWVNKGTKPNGERYRADIILYLCLGVQQHLRENHRIDSIFYDKTYHPFVEAMTNYAESDCAQGIIARIEDSHFWESNELGDSSPGVLLFSLIYFIFKHFNLRTWEKHAALHFGQIRIEEEVKENGLRHKVMSIVDVPECEGISVRERSEDVEKCPVKLLVLYLEKCELLDGPFYKSINPFCVSSLPKWFSSTPLNQMEIYQMLVRAMMIKTDTEVR